MTTQSFENLDFSLLIDADQKIAYLQEWEEGNWSEPVQFELPQTPEALKGTSKLALAVRSFRGDAQIGELRNSLTHGAWKIAMAETSGAWTRFWTALQASFRELATVRVKETS